MCKQFGRKFQKCIILAYFSKHFKNPPLNFRALLQKTQMGGKILEIFLTYCNEILKKFQKCIISAYFSKRVKNPALNFRAFGQKTQMGGNF